jgi:hypothetical protein
MIVRMNGLGAIRTRYLLTFLRHFFYARDSAIQSIYAGLKNAVALMTEAIVESALGFSARLSV